MAFEKSKLCVVELEPPLPCMKGLSALSVITEIKGFW